MTEKECIKNTVLIFEEFYRQVTLNQGYELKLTKNNKVMVAKFVVWVNQHFTNDTLKNGLLRVGDEWMVEYFKFQFNYWIWKIEKDKEYYRYGLGSIQLNYVLGKQAIERFLKQEKTMHKFKFIRLINKAEVTVLHTLKERNPVNVRAFVDTFVKDNELEERETFYSTNEGLINCLGQTTLFNPKLDLCTKCSNRALCKDLLKENYPNLYKIRIDGV